MVDAMLALTLPFQSTPPARGATTREKAKEALEAIFQSTPPARGATSFFHILTYERILISIHAPREGGDPDFTNSSHSGQISIHAPREGGDAANDFQRGRQGLISIHAPREGGDKQGRPRLAQGRDFNPRPPRGGRRQGSNSCFVNRSVISIHAPREGGDGEWDACRKILQEFQSTPPARGATAELIA